MWPTDNADNWFYLSRLHVCAVHLPQPPRTLQVDLQKKEACNQSVLTVVTVCLCVHLCASKCGWFWRSRNSYLFIVLFITFTHTLRHRSVHRLKPCQEAQIMYRDPQHTGKKKRGESNQGHRDHWCVCVYVTEKIIKIYRGNSMD